MEIDKNYEPQRVEPRWADWWIESGIYHANVDAPGPVFSLAIPPPNVTGSLHVGHMFEHSLIDVAVRWHRMRGDNTLWLPGTDHAGIATQMLVERKLAAEGTNRHALGREEFERRVWEWKEQYGGLIVKQMKRVGESCDWSREHFTMDADLSRAVREAFVRLYEKGLIYRGAYMVNWCPSCQTALSDLEVAHEDTQGSLWHIRYPLADGSGSITVATTRPETMLGDTAVAMHPEDPRVATLPGKTLRLPLTDREIPIVLDTMVDPKFGSGFVKITPAHDPNDFEAGKRHSLQSIKVLDENAKMTAAAGRFAGMDRFAARKAVVAALKELDLVEKIDDYTVSLSKCSRCKTVVEPLESLQWWVKMKPLAAPAIAAVESGRTTFVPANWAKTYFEWMYNIRDWCVSRQLWWGHRIPAWHCQACREIIVSREDPTVCTKCGSADLRQDTDVLDTWFSSGLWPFSTLGWPDKTPDLAKYYPNTLLVTGFDIIFFWAARMMVFGIEFLGEPPFKQIHIHGLVRDADGQKMSKTKGNVVDLLEVNEKYGTDAVRFALLVSAAAGADVSFGEERLTSARNFTNKIWNASRLIFSRVGTKLADLDLNPDRNGGDAAGEHATATNPSRDQRGPKGHVGSGHTGTPLTDLEDRWIVSRLNATAEKANRAIETHRYHEAADALWAFFWDDFCDWYLELIKLRTDVPVLLWVYERALRLLHPMMPFLTEELWQRLESAAGAKLGKSISLAAYPVYEEALHDAAAESEMATMQSIITSARTIRAERKIDRKLNVPGTLYAEGAAIGVARARAAAIEKLANVTLALKEGKAPKLEGAVRSTPEFDLILELPEAEGERDRLIKENEQLRKVIENSERQLANEDFIQKAPEKVIATIRQKKADYEAQVTKNLAAIERSA